ncbi:MAG: DUF922 domain-containing Zn-dependent protease [Candidatus Adiutrix sp.]|jgi:predicted secreted Zn-dependent protease|nr:DUF922 domain-containing Zn-dependent protease [Candidatus Adiutrix sp.]
MMFKVAFFISAALSLCCASSSFARPQISVEYDYYQAPAAAGLSLSEIIFSATPIVSDGRKYGGVARCRISYQFGYDRPRIDVCRVSDLAVASRCVITLPSLAGGGARMREEFAAYVEKLKEHELIHARISAEYAAKIHEALLNLGEHRCDRIEARAEAAAAPLLAECDSAQKRFDHNSNHGNYDGVKLNMTLAEAAAQAGRRRNGGGQALKNLKPLDPENLKQAAPDEAGGIFKDSDGVWRNY